MKKQGFAGFLRRKQYVIAGAIVVIAAIGTTALYSNNQEKQREQMEAEIAAESTQKDAVAVEEDTQESAEASAVIPPETNPAENAVELEDLSGLTAPEASLEDAEQVAEEESEGEAQETATSGDTLHFAPEDGMVWPMEGDVILNYSMDSTVYFATLDQYKYNPAVIIAGEVNNKVYSVAKGQVTDISNNEVTGCTMTVDLGDGYQAIYGQIKEPNFAVGDYVESGHVIGFVAEPTKYFSVEGSNLYFALEKDGEPVNPVEFFE